MSLFMPPSRHHSLAPFTRRWRLRLGLLLLPFQLGAENYLKWDDIIGRSFEAKIVGASSREVRLENREGKENDFPIADLKPSSREQARAWQTTRREAEEAAASPAALKKQHMPSVFDDELLGDLVRLKGKRLKRCKDATRPEKYYLFYYTASWCGPCQRYTPQLVEWYNKNKNDNFELVLITSDRSEDAMEGYAASKKMPWPQLDIKKTQDFKERFDHGVRGIPSLIVCELDGKNLGNFRSRLDALSEMVR